MGRPKKFSREGVLEKALPVFWQHGFARTSLQDLELATGVNKSGLYAEFTSKEALFVACLDYYMRSRSGIRVLLAEPLGWDNIERFLHEGPSRILGQSGCFSVNSMRELSGLPPEVKDVMVEARKKLDRLIKANIAAAHPKLDPESICHVVSVFFSGICIESNLQTDCAHNQKKVASFMQMLRTL